MFGLSLVLCSANESIFFQLEPDVWRNTAMYMLDNIHKQRTTVPPSPSGSPQISKLPRVPIGKSGKQLNLEILGLRSPHAGPFVDVPRIWESIGRGHGGSTATSDVGGRLRRGGARKLSESFWTFVTPGWRLPMLG